jgi:hypothetical protein
VGEKTKVFAVLKKVSEMPKVVITALGFFVPEREGF